MDLEELEETGGKPVTRKSCDVVNVSSGRKGYQRPIGFLPPHKPDGHLGAVEQDRWDDYGYGSPYGPSGEQRDHYGFHLPYRTPNDVADYD